MAIVARGLGQPEDGALVVGGLGTVTVGPNAMSATLTGTSTLTATLTAGDVEPPVVGGGAPGGARVRFVQLPPLVNQPRSISATLTGSGELTAHLDFTVDFDAELEQLLLVGAL